MTESALDYQEPGQFQFIPQKSNKFALPLVKTADGQLSVPAEVMTGIWHQICYEGKDKFLFYDSAVNDLKGWIDYIYNPNNYVILIIDNLGHVYHIAWINKVYQGHAFLHHVALGKYSRSSWPIVRDYYRNLIGDDGRPIIKVLLGITPANNEKAIKLVKLLKWNIVGSVPYLCYLANEKRHVNGLVSYYVLEDNEV